MIQKGVISNNDKIFIPIFIISLILSSILAGDLVLTFIFLLISIVVISFVYSIIKTKVFNNELIIKIKESSYILSFSVLTTLIITIILPYVFFHNSFVNIYVIQYVYLFPVLFIFSVSLYLYSYLIYATYPPYKDILKYSIMITIILSIIISLVLVVSSNHIYNSRTELFNKAFDEYISEFNNETVNSYNSKLEIFNEIKIYHNNFLDEANKQKSIFQNFDEHNGLCISTNCAKNIVDKAHHLIVVVVNSAVIRGTLERANKELDYINSQEFKQNFTSLDEFKIHLKSRIDASEFTISDLSYADKNTLNLLESKFMYQDFKTSMEQITQREENAELSGLFSGSSSLVGIDSLFYNSISHTIRHSLPFKELFRLSIKYKLYLEQQGRNSDLFVQIYENQDIKESTESKIIRYKLLLTRLE